VLDDDAEIVTVEVAVTLDVDEVETVVDGVTLDETLTVALAEEEALGCELVEGREEAVADAEADGVGGGNLSSEISVFDNE
jgi:hypothetical protein